VRELSRSVNGAAKEFQKFIIALLDGAKGAGPHRRHGELLVRYDAHPAS
jgi:hypothetical protein